MEAPGPRKTDLGLQAIIPEINNDANQDNGMLLCEREMLVSGLGKTGGRAEKGEQMYNLLGQRGSEGPVREEVKLDREQETSHFGRMLGEAGATCEMKLEARMEHGTSS